MKELRTIKPNKLDTRLDSYLRSEYDLTRELVQYCAYANLALEKLNIEDIEINDNVWDWRSIYFDEDSEIRNITKYPDYVVIEFSDFYDSIDPMKLIIYDNHLNMNYYNIAKDIINKSKESKEIETQEEINKIETKLKFYNSRLEELKNYKESE